MGEEGREVCVPLRCCVFIMWQKAGARPPPSLFHSLSLPPPLKRGIIVIEPRNLTTAEGRWVRFHRLHHHLVLPDAAAVAVESYNRRRNSLEARGLPLSLSLSRDGRARYLPETKANRSINRTNERTNDHPI